ncbi:MAG: HesA/MoeB/ThiF family protein [Pseudoflavonifractor sp.]|nr:HesA/MoeB/ThiF family protein [Pseudoflavonifractor sp.]
MSELCKFSKEQLDRYRGHISLCEIDSPGQSAICHGKVLIVGAGGLGSPVALYLAAAGVGNIGLVDADKVSLGNLQRQIIHSTADLGTPKVISARNAMTALNPEISVTPYELYLDSENVSEIFSGYDLIMDCTDNFDTRLLINDACVELGKPFIFGAVSRFSGQVFTHIPGSGDIRAFFGNDYPDDNEPCAITGILNTVVGVIGSLQATEAIKYLAGTGDLLVNRLLVFDGITMQFNTLALPSK